MTKKQGIYLFICLFALEQQLLQHLPIYNIKKNPENGMFELCWRWRFLSSFIFKMDCEGVGFVVLVLCMEQGSFSPWWSTRNILFLWVSVCFTAEGSSPVHDHLHSKAGSRALLHCGNVCFLGPLCSGFAARSGVLQAPRTSPSLWKDKRTKWGESLWFCAVRMTFSSGGKKIKGC